MVDIRMQSGDFHLESVETGQYGDVDHVSEASSGERVASISWHPRHAKVEASPASAETVESPKGRARFAQAVLEYAGRRITSSGRSFDIMIPEFHHFLAAIADHSHDDRFRLGPFHGTLSTVGGEPAFKPGFRSLAILRDGAAEGWTLTWGADPPAFGVFPVRVCKRLTALLIGLGEINANLAGHLAGLGFRVILGEQPDRHSSDGVSELVAVGFRILDLSNPQAVVESLSADGLSVVVEGYSPGTTPLPEGGFLKFDETAEQANRRAAEQIASKLGCPIVYKDDPKGAELFFVSCSEPPAIVQRIGFAGELETAYAELLAPLFELDDIRGGVEIHIDNLIPTSPPYGELNRHSTDGASLRDAGKLESRTLELFERIDSSWVNLLGTLSEPGPREGRNVALSIQNRIGPWTIHTFCEITVRAHARGGEPLTATAYADLLQASEGIRLVDFARDGHGLRLDSTKIQNILFQKLGEIYDHKITAALVQQHDENFKIVALIPQESIRIPARLHAVLRAVGAVDGNLAPANALIDRKLSLSRSDLRIAEFLDRAAALEESTTAGADTTPVLSPPASEIVDLSLLEGVAPQNSGDGPAPLKIGIASERDLGDSKFGISIDGVEVLEATKTSGDLTIRTCPRAPVNMDDPLHRRSYFYALLGYIHGLCSRDRVLIQLVDRYQSEFKLFLAGEAGGFHRDPRVAGRQIAPFALGRLAGMRSRLGGDVHDNARVMHVDLFIRDDPAPTPQAATVAFSSIDEGPLIAAPATVQLAFGFGGISGDLAVLSRRLAFKVTAWNRTPNERARHALANGIPLFEFDEMFDFSGGRLLTGQAAAYKEAGIALSGSVRDLLDRGLLIGTTDSGTQVRAPVGHIMDGLFLETSDPRSGESIKTSELYRDLLFEEYEKKGIPTIYQGYNEPAVVAGGRIFLSDAFRLSGASPDSYFSESGRRRNSVQCLSCNTTNIATLLLELSNMKALTDLTVRVMTHRKFNDPNVGEGRQAANYLGMTFNLAYHHWEDSKLIFDRMESESRDRLFEVFRKEIKHAGGALEPAISTDASFQSGGTEFHVGLVRLSGRLDGGPLDVHRIKLELLRSRHVQYIDFPMKVDSTVLVETLHRRIGIRNLYVQPVTAVQDGDDVLLVFFTPHLFNTKPNALLAALNRTGLLPNTLEGIDSGQRLVASQLRIEDQKKLLARYFPVRLRPGLVADPEPVYRFGERGAAMPGGDDAAARRWLCGGKAAGLMEISNLQYKDPSSGRTRDMPVPPGFTITTEQARLYFEEGHRLSPRLREEIERNLEWLQERTGARFGDPTAPLLLAVRSGARISMPGMMDTILNVGLSPDVAGGLAKISGDPLFAWDSYRRFIEVFAGSVLGLDRSAVLEPFKAAALNRLGMQSDSELSARSLKKLVEEYLAAVAGAAGTNVLEHPREQLLRSIEAVFASTFSDRARTYRRIQGIPDDTYSSVTVMAMVYGNRDLDSGAGVAFTRDPISGARGLHGSYLLRAQGEDVVGGSHTVNDLPSLRDEKSPRLRECAARLDEIGKVLEGHYREPQDIEFTIEDGDLWILQTRNLGGRTGRGALRMAMDMVQEGLQDERGALLDFGDPSSLNDLLNPTFSDESVARAAAEGRMAAQAIAGSPGAVTAPVVFDPDEAVKMAREGRPVILARPETTPADIDGMNSAAGMLTTYGGYASHAAIVARALGKPAVVGAESIVIDERAGEMIVDGTVIKHGDTVSIDGARGQVFRGEVDVQDSPIKRQLNGEELDEAERELSHRFYKFLGWADEHRTLKIFANADTPAQIRDALALGGEGIGLLRTENMFFGPEPERRTAFAAMIIARDEAQRRRALDAMYRYHSKDLLEIFRLMSGRPVTVRLMDPVVNEFIPKTDAEVERVAEFMQLSAADVRELAGQRTETNSMLGHRGIRLPVTYPEIGEMQIRTVFQSAARVIDEGGAALPQIELPMVFDVGEVRELSRLADNVAAGVERETGVRVDYKLGIMAETPAAIIRAAELAREIDFYYFGPNDLTQLTLGMSRDDATFLPFYLEHGILGADPFQTIQGAVLDMVKEGVRRARSAKADIDISTGGELGGDPKSVKLFHSIGFTGVSASPFKIPVARLAAAQAAIAAAVGQDPG